MFEKLDGWSWLLIDATAVFITLKAPWLWLIIVGIIIIILAILLINFSNKYVSYEFKSSANSTNYTERQGPTPVQQPKPESTQTTTYTPQHNDALAQQLNDKDERIEELWQVVHGLKEKYTDLKSDNHELNSKNQKLEKTLNTVLGYKFDSAAIKEIDATATKLASKELNKIESYDGFQFENYLGFLLRDLHFSNVSVTKKSSDQGIDIIAEKRGIKYGFQCKHYHDKVTNKAVQEVYAGLAVYHLDKGVVITNNKFTESAVQLAQQTNTELWDKNTLKELIIKAMQKTAADEYYQKNKQTNI